MTHIFKNNAKYCWSKFVNLIRIIGSLSAAMKSIRCSNYRTHFGFSFLFYQEFIVGLYIRAITFLKKKLGTFLCSASFSFGGISRRDSFRWTKTTARSLRQRSRYPEDKGSRAKSVALGKKERGPRQVSLWKEKREGGRHGPGNPNRISLSDASN